MTAPHTQCQPEITDAMCEAAIKADQIDRMQGFTYDTRHVIRDVWKPWDEQKIWEINRDEADAEWKFHHQHRIERFRMILRAALSVGTGT